MPTTAVRATAGTAWLGSRPETAGSSDDGLNLRVLWLPDCGIAAYGCSAPGPGAVENLAAELLGALAGAQHRREPSTRRQLPSLIRNPLGKPLLLGDGMACPAISFSRAPGRLWGAAANGRGVGIDSAAREEFCGNYPFHRIFGSNELSVVTAFIGTDLPSAAACTWAIKEAAVKAAGTGFHGYDPRDVQVVSLEPSSGGYLSIARVGLNCPVWLRREGPCWVAVALIP